MNLKDKFYKFMYARYGVDDLYKFLFKLYIFVFLMNIFIKSSILTYLNIMVIIIMLYRTFSKNIYQRSKENKIYLNIKQKLLKPLKNFKRNLKDKENIYKKCSKCKTTLKLPRPYEKGIKHAKCPNCGKRLTVFVFKSKKIEIIKNKKYS